MTLRSMLLWAVIAFAVLFLGFFVLSPRHRDQLASDLVTAPAWQRMAAPGELSKAHAFLKNNCAACHTPIKGVEASTCIVCHANITALLQRQPTAFHANVGNCTECHREHLGVEAELTTMDHAALSRIGLRQLDHNPDHQTDDRMASAQLANWIREQGPHASPQASTKTSPGQVHSGLTAQEKILNCVACHGSKDRHVGLFGQDCAQCHGSAAWTIPAFRHPPPTSMDCAQCHQAPPSHYMMHFKMVSMATAGVEKADVTQCFICHQTTSWNDIKGIGYYKHH